MGPGGPSRPGAAPHLDRARELVRALAGVDLAPYKGNLLARRLRARCRDRGLPSVEAYLALLEAGGSGAEEEARRLGASLSVQVSEFFRDRAVFETLETVVYPELFGEAGAGARVRVWSAACAGGQEAYSLAISLWRYARGRSPGTRISVLGTDLDEAALEEARRGIYGPRALERAPAEAVAEAFTALPDGRWAVRDEVRRLVRFERRDLLDPAAHPAEVDLLSCRNILIYLDRAAQEELILALRGVLRPGGYLVLGTSETLLGRPWRRFEHVDPAHRIYRRPPKSAGPSPDREGP